MAEEICSMPSIASGSSGSPSEARSCVLTGVASLMDCVPVSMTWSTGDLRESAKSCILTPLEPSSWEADELELDKDGVGAEVG